MAYPLNPAQTQVHAQPASRRAIPLGNPRRKPLYLFAEAHCACDAQEGVLVLRRPEEPIQRFPLARITRIVSNCQASWTGRALSACLARGITITWVDGHGHALGSTQPCHSQPECLATQIETYLELKDWASRFANWRARRRLDALLCAAGRLDREGCPMSAGRFAELRRSYVRCGAFAEIFDPVGQSMCYALIVDRLSKLDLQSRYFGFDGQVLDLGSELADLLWAELNFDAGTLVAHTQKRTLLTRVFEAWASQREGRLLEHLGDLRRHLSREIESWQ